jgi:hypothetical protein
MSTSRKQTTSVEVTKEAAPVSTPRHGVSTVSRSERTLKTATGHAAIDRARALSPEARTAMIAQAAYFRAERRGFTPGQELQDWVAAEQEVERLLSASAAPLTEAGGH